MNDWIARHKPQTEIEWIGLSGLLVGALAIVIAVIIIAIWLF